MNFNHCVLYRDMEQGHILQEMVWLYQSIQKEDKDVEILSNHLYSLLHDIVELSARYGFIGNLWQTYLTFLLVSDENAFSKACEISKPVSGTLKDLAFGDFSIFRDLFEMDFSLIERSLDVDCLSVITNYQAAGIRKGVFNARIRDCICDLSISLSKATDLEAFGNLITTFYREYGVGKLGLHKAFRVEEEGGLISIEPIKNIAHVHLDDLIGLEIPKKKLIDNTEAFVSGRKANNCLLFGDAGTGKSSSVKAILNQYYDRGLRMIEIYRHQFHCLNDVIAQIKNRNYRFIIYMDDLSFEEFETEYKYLKAVIEGGLEKKPENVLIYATSNRRHIVREEFSDKAGRRDDLHASDTVQEKLSLAARFGVSIFFVGPSKKEYRAIVLELARRSGIEMGEDDLLLEANKWELSHGGLSGRTAQQFIDYLLGQEI